ncbi:hypothetical protein MTBSS4_190029 [Magnetospirillum sp. SS-4]|nr:hypothetical protein MTBSS4_190029 [Magnetospirillum sp. SS-4]
MGHTFFIHVNQSIKLYAIVCDIICPQ